MTTAETCAHAHLAGAAQPGASSSEDTREDADADADAESQQPEVTAAPCYGHMHARIREHAHRLAKLFARVGTD